jgi:hypothetical protein
MPTSELDISGVYAVESGQVVYIVEVQPGGSHVTDTRWQMRQGAWPTSNLDEALKTEAHWKSIAPNWNTRIAKFLRMPDDAETQ